MRAGFSRSRAGVGRLKPALTLLLFLAVRVQAQDIPLLDSDNFARGFHAPSMEQAVSWTAAFYDSSHRAIQRAWGTREHYAKTSIAIFDFVTLAVLAMPLSDVWVHEEFHRAVLANRGVASFDDVYRFRLSAGSIAVSHVRDDALVRMKRDHPADLVRAHEAGIEGEAATVLRLEKDHFFHGATSWNLPLYWFAKTNSIAYIANGPTRSTNDTTRDWERDEGASISKRDFTGHDFTAWVYDLFRADEPYEARGIHPSGVGIRRYVRESDLTPEEKSYLRRQGRLAAINLLDPNLYGGYGLTSHGRAINVAASHTLTPFGYAIDVNTFLRDRDHRVFVVLHLYRNHERTFPGLELELPGARITPRLALWSQPSNQRFRDSAGRFGALAGVQVRRGRWYAELDAKSAGWVAANVHLDRSASARLGFALR